jgi:hypothetical protein
MKPTIVSKSLFTLVALSCVASANAQGERNLRDAGRVYREPAAAPAIAGARTYHLYMTPTYGWDDNLQAFGGQFKYANDKLIANRPFSVTASVSSLRFNAVGPAAAVSKMSSALGAEIDVLSSASYSLNLSGSVNRVEDVGTSMEFAPEFDWVLPANKMFTGAIGAIMYMNRFSTIETPTTPSVSTDGNTFGVLAYLNRGSWGLIPEYDFNSDYVGEDSFSVKLSKRFATMKGDPRIMVGFAKHDRFLAAGRWTLR